MSWTKKIIFISIPFILFLGLAEFVLRVFFPILDPFVLQRRPFENLTLSSDGTSMPGISGTTTFITDELGFRTSHGISYLNKPKNTIRIFFIGASTIEQLYLDDSKDYTHVLERKLNDRLLAAGSPYRVETINTGRSGLHSVDHWRMAQEVEKYKPDYEVFLMGINDLSVNLNTKGDAANRKHYFAAQVHNSKRYIVTRSHLARLAFYTKAVVESLIKGEVMDTAGQQYTTRRQKRRDSPLIPLEDNLKDVPVFYTENVSMIRDVLEKGGIKGVFMTQPTMWSKDMPAELDSLLWMTPFDANFRYDTGELDGLMEKYNDVLRNAAEQSSTIDLIDLSKVLPKDTTVFYDDVHFNNSGAEKISDILFDYFVEQFKTQGIL